MADDPRVAQWNERYAGDDYIFGEVPNASWLRKRRCCGPACGR